MAGVQAGRLSIEIVAEVARLQQDLDKAKRAVKAMSNEIARDTKAANDNFTRMGQNFDRTGQRIVASAGAQRAGMQQLSYQIGDVAQQFALGVRPQVIFAQQAGQVVQAIQLASGGAGRFAAFLGGPWGIALTAAAVVVTPLIGKLFEAEDAAKKVEFASYALGDAQSILGGVMDLTTGKINTQSQALLALARAQAIAGRIGAETRAAEARSQVRGLQDKEWVFGGNFMGVDVSRQRPIQGQVSSQLLNDVITGEQAIKKLERLRDVGRITNKVFLEAAQAVANLGVETENIKVFEELERALDGDKGALQQFLKPNTGRQRRERKPGLSDEQKELRQRNQETERFIENLEEEIAKIGLDEKALRQLEVARAAEIAITAQQRAEIALLNEEREKAIAAAERELRLKEAQKETEKLAGSIEAVRRDAQVFELVGWAREKALKQLEREAEIKPLLAKQTEALARGEEALATEIGKQIALLNERYGLQIQMGDRIDQQAQWEKRWGNLRDYLATIHMTAEESAKAFEDVKMRGLDALNDGIVDAILNFNSLGDVAQNILRQILADLLRLQIRKSIIGPLADALGLALPGGSGSTGGGGAVDLLAGTPFGGGRASGGPVAAGTSYLVGEHGPEMLTMGSSGFITPNDQLVSGQQRVLVELVDTTGLFVTRVNGQIVDAMPAAAEASAQATEARMGWYESRRIPS